MSDSLLSQVTTLLVLVDPLGVLAIFIGLTAGATRAERRRIAVKGGAVASAILVAFALVGGPLLALLGIELSAFRIAGGLMLLFIAHEMLFEKRTQRRDRSAQAVEREKAGDDPVPEAAEGEPPPPAAPPAAGDPASDPSVFPLAIPLLAGPGAITAVLLFSRESSGSLGLAGVVLAIALVMGPTLRGIG